MKTDLVYLIQKSENQTTEFKESKSKLNKNIYETVCAFLNGDGGDIILGVRDDGIVAGVDDDKIKGMKKDFLTAINNPQKLNPPCYLSVDIVEIDTKKVMHIFVPPSSSVHILTSNQAYHSSTIQAPPKHHPSRKHFKTSILNPLIESKLLALTIPDKPNSPKQKYIATDAK